MTSPLDGPDGHAAANWPQGVHFTDDDRVLIDQAKREHRETTASARRALQVSEAAEQRAGLGLCSTGTALLRAVTAAGLDHFQ